MAENAFFLLLFQLCVILHESYRCCGLKYIHKFEYNVWFRRQSYKNGNAKLFIVGERSHKKTQEDYEFCAVVSGYYLFLCGDVVSFFKKILFIRGKFK